MPEDDRAALLVEEAGDSSRIPDPQAVRSTLEDLVNRRRVAVGVDGRHEAPDFSPYDREEPDPSVAATASGGGIAATLLNLELGLPYDEHTGDLNDGRVVPCIVVRRSLAAVFPDAYYG